MSDGPLIVQSDKTLLLEVDHPLAEGLPRSDRPFAELERSPEHVHTYRVTPLTLWNAASPGTRPRGGRRAGAVLAVTRCRRARGHVADTMDRYGRLPLANGPVSGWCSPRPTHGCWTRSPVGKRDSPEAGAGTAIGVVHASERGGSSRRC